jgi:hypothetical protein
MFGSDRMRWPEKIGEAIEAIEQAPFLTEVHGMGETIQCSDLSGMRWTSALESKRTDENPNVTRASETENCVRTV